MEQNRLSIRALVVLAAELGAAHLFGVRDPFLMLDQKEIRAAYESWRNWSRSVRLRGNLKARLLYATICGGKLKSARGVICILLLKRLPAGIPSRPLYFTVGEIIGYS